MSLNLRRLDLNLLTVFEAVYEERSQQKASERLFMSQPAISNAISRLRALLDDRLFYGNKTIQTTLKADELYPQVHQALDLIRAEILEKKHFVAERSGRNFTIAISYESGFLLGSPIYNDLMRLAPLAKLTIRSIDPQDEIPRLLRDQTIDLAVTHRDFDDAMLVSEECLQFEMVAVARQNHPRMNATPNLDALEQEHYVAVHDFSYRIHDSSLRTLMEVANLRAKVEVPTALMLPVILEDSDLVALLPRAHADLMAKHYALSIYPLPIKQSVSHMHLIWHRAYEKDPDLEWFRNACLETFHGVRQRLEKLYSGDQANQPPT
jgi:LysR family transcriptional regulator, transcriptional activator for leuABCD operon